jgi:hypothetical protein
MACDGDTLIDELLGCLDLFWLVMWDGAGDLARDASPGAATPFDLSGRIVRRVEIPDSFTNVASDSKLGILENEGLKESSSSLLIRFQCVSNYYCLSRSFGIKNPLSSTRIDKWWQSDVSTSIQTLNLGLSSTVPCVAAGIS